MRALASTRSTGPRKHVWSETTSQPIVRATAIAAGPPPSLSRRSGATSPGRRTRRGSDGTSRYRFRSGLSAWYLPRERFPCPSSRQSSAKNERIGSVRSPPTRALVTGGEGLGAPSPPRCTRPELMWQSWVARPRPTRQRRPSHQTNGVCTPIRADCTTRTSLAAGSAGARSSGRTQYLRGCPWDRTAPSCARARPRHMGRDPRDESDVVFELCQLAARTMIPQGRGKIVTIASMLSSPEASTLPRTPPAKEVWRSSPRRWRTVGAAGNRRTPERDRSRVHQDGSQQTHLARRSGSHRRDPHEASREAMGEPDDLTGAAIFLCSPAANYVHGIVLPVDGGWLAR